MGLYFIGCDAENIENNLAFQNEITRLGGVQVLKSLWCFNVEGVKPEDIRTRFMRFVEDEARLMIIESGMWSSKSAITSPNKARALEIITTSIGA